MDSPTSATDEQEILRIAKEVIEQLNISNFRPVQVSWADDVLWTQHDTENVMPEIGLVKRDVPIGLCIFTWDSVILLLR